MIVLPAKFVVGCFVAFLLLLAYVVFYQKPIK